jgi:hypothetical protein
MPIDFASEVRLVIPDFPAKLSAASLEQPIKVESVKSSEFSWMGFTSNFQQPLPKFLPIDSSELTWLSPGILTDVMWDSTSRIT